ncbi:unnamed protein product [Pieris macdunnoughi]|uniref:Uncharacterized protein n=1 Tax=Pieris macdunnoughi TaxID=345717 RepID=A0A821X4N8_9NEOP|nr:unnamed protein product [Pieris macdunnoughi]
MLAWGAGRGSAGPSLPPKKPELSDTDSEAQSALLTSAAALARRRRAVKLKRKITFKVSRKLTTTAQAERVSWETPLRGTSLFPAELELKTARAELALQANSDFR